ncbi:FAD-dependent oxidoreductase [Actinomycetes bacterium KLBMP 9759]
MPVMRIVVVGAGVGGLAAAAALSRSGHDVTVLERNPTVREAGVGLAVMPNGVVALDRLGFGEAVRAETEGVDIGGGFYDRRGRRLLVVDQDAIESAPERGR